MNDHREPKDFWQELRIHSHDIPDSKKSRSAVKDYYPKVEYLDTGFLQDTKTIGNLSQPDIWRRMIQVSMTS